MGDSGQWASALGSPDSWRGEQCGKGGAACPRHWPPWCWGPGTPPARTCGAPLACRAVPRAGGHGAILGSQGLSTCDKVHFYRFSRALGRVAEVGEA